AAICANAGEIAVLGGALEKTESPDSMIEENEPEIAAAVAKKYKTVVIATGKTDVITDGTRTTLCNNGHKMLTNITASGCLLTSLMRAFAGVTENIYDVSIQATVGYGIAAEVAMEIAEGPGTFIPALLDQLYFMDDKTVVDNLRIKE